MIEETVHSSMRHMWSTRHLTWHETLVIYLIFFGVCAVIFAVVKWRWQPVTRKILLFTGWLILIAGLLSFFLRLSGLLGGRAMLVGQETAGMSAMWWWELRSVALFLCASVVSALTAFMCASLIDVRTGLKDKK
jgi:hypothetical protein